MIRELNAEFGCLEYVSGRKRDPNGALETQRHQRPRPAAAAAPARLSRLQAA